MATEKQQVLIEKLALESATLIDEIKNIIETDGRNRFTLSTGPRLIEDLTWGDEMDRNILKHSPSQHIELRIDLLRKCRIMIANRG